MANELSADISLANLMKIGLSCRILNPSGVETYSGEASAELREDGLSLLMEDTDHINCSYRDMESIEALDYRIHIKRFQNGELTLFYLGYAYEDFLAQLIRLRNDVILHDLLIKERLLLEKVEGVWFAPEGKHGLPCEIRLYDTALVVLPFNGELMRLHYSEILEVTKEDYRINIRCEDQGIYSIGQLGRQLDWLMEHFEAAMIGLAKKTQALLQTVIPQLSTETLDRLVPLLREGKSAMRWQIDQIDPKAWNALEERLAVSGAYEEYRFLASLAQNDRISIGIKRGLMGDLTGEYCWFLIPIYSPDPEKPGNLVALEAAGTDQSKATYFFRMMEYEAYRSMLNMDELHQRVDSFLRELNRAMIAVNFRREPIYLTDERLQSQEYAGYRFAVTKIPGLKMLRSHFIGRVIHSNRWRENVEALIHEETKKRMNGVTK